MAEIAR